MAVVFNTRRRAYKDAHTRSRQEGQPYYVVTMKNTEGRTRFIVQDYAYDDGSGNVVACYNVDTEVGYDMGSWSLDSAGNYVPRTSL